MRNEASTAYVAGKEQIVFGEQTTESHPREIGLRGSRNNARRSTARKNRGDGEAYLVNEPCFGHAAVEGRPAFAEHHRGTPSVKFVEHRFGMRFGQGKANNLGVESPKTVGVRLFTSDDQRSLVICTVRVTGIGQSRNSRINISAGSHDGQTRGPRAACGESASDHSLRWIRRTVLLGTGGGGRNQDPVATCPDRAKHSAVCGSTESAAEAVDCAGAIEAGDHVDHDPRAVGRCGPSLVQIDVERVDAFDPGGKNLLHCGRPYRFAPVIPVPSDSGPADSVCRHRGLSTAKATLVDRTRRNPQLNQNVFHFSSTSERA